MSKREDFEVRIFSVSFLLREIAFLVGNLGTNKPVVFMSNSLFEDSFGALASSAGEGLEFGET